MQSRQPWLALCSGWHLKARDLQARGSSPPSLTAILSPAFPLVPDLFPGNLATPASASQNILWFPKHGLVFRSFCLNASPTSPLAQQAEAHIKHLSWRRPSPALPARGSPASPGPPGPRAVPYHSLHLPNSDRESLIQGTPRAGTSFLPAGGGSEGGEGGQGAWDCTLSRRKGVMML